MDTREYESRKTLLHLIRSGQSVAAATKAVGRSRSWGHKWWGRFQSTQDWASLRDQPRTPHHQPTQLSASVRQAIRHARSALEAQAHEKAGLGYIGAYAIQAHLRAQNVQPVPSISSVERELRAAGLVRPYHAAAVAVHYPHLCPTQPHELIQADILPRHLTGGNAIACFNAIDVVSRYPSGRQFARRTARNACEFLWAVWQEQGIPRYQQLDNESCFSGGVTHPAVVGQVLHLGLFVGTQLVFSPFYHPQSNGSVERFHQEYARFVWQRESLPDLAAVRQRSRLFFGRYRASGHQRPLQGRSPNDCHPASSSRTIPPDYRLPRSLPSTVGQVHFMRAVTEQSQVRVLNLAWDVPQAQAHQGVWVTLRITLSGATLSVFDAPPDTASRICYITHPFPLHKEVVLLAPPFQPPQHAPHWLAWVSRTLRRLTHSLSTMS
jgi:hypothetical protein